MGMVASLYWARGGRESLGHSPRLLADPLLPGSLPIRCGQRPCSRHPTAQGSGCCIKALRTQLMPAFPERCCQLPIPEGGPGQGWGKHHPRPACRRDHHRLRARAPSLCFLKKATRVTVAAVRARGGRRTGTRDGRAEGPQVGRRPGFPRLPLNPARPRPRRARAGTDPLQPSPRAVPEGSASRGRREPDVIPREPAPLPPPGGAAPPASGPGGEGCGGRTGTHALSPADSRRALLLSVRPPRLFSLVGRAS